MIAIFVEHFCFSGSSPNVRQRAPIAKNISSQEEGLRGGSLKGSTFEGVSHREISHGLQMSPERSLLSSSHESQRSDSIDAFLQDREPNAFRSQKG